MKSVWRLPTFVGPAHIVNMVINGGSNSNSNLSLETRVLFVGVG